MDWQDYQQQGGVTHFWHRARLGLIKFLIGRLTDKQTIAAIGCGTGEELAILSERGQVIGYDINQQALAIATKQGWPTAHWDITQKPLPQTFTAVCAFDCLEHLADDQLALNHIKQSLAPGGSLLITVPALPWLMSAHDLALGHYRRYSKKLLSQKLQQAGFVIKTTGYWNCLLAPAIILVRLFKKFWPPAVAQSEAKTPPSLLNGLGLTILTTETNLLKLGVRWPWGISLYALAQKHET